MAPAPQTLPRIRAAERGVTMIEMMVVLLIITILASLGYVSVRNARTTGRSLSTMATAHAYGNAIDLFARDHRGRYPGPPGSADWPTSGPDGAGRGPAADVLGTVRYYLRSVPESVQDGSVTIGGSGSARLTYAQLGGGTGYELIVTVDGRPPCAIRGGTTSGASAANDCGRR